MEQLFRSEDAAEGLQGVRREAHAGVRGPMSTETIVTHPGSFVAGASTRTTALPLPIVNPGTGQVFAEVPGGTEADVDAAVRAARDALRDWSAMAVSKRGEILGSGGAPRRGAPRRAGPAADARAGQDASRLADRDHQGDRHADALRRAVEGPARRARSESGPRGRRHGAAPPARRGRRDRPVELPDDAAVQQARAGRRRRQHGRRQAGGHDTADDAAVCRAAGRGRAARPACSTS